MPSHQSLQSPVRELLQQVVDTGCSGEPRGAALYRQAEQILANPEVSDWQARALLQEIVLYAAARRQRVRWGERAEQLYQRLEDALVFA